jgi:tight adherence protein C
VNPVVPLLTLATFAVGLHLAWLARPRDERTRALATLGESQGGPSPARLFEVVGRALLRAAKGPVPEPSTARRIGRTAVIGLLTFFLVGPIAAAAVGALLWIAPPAMAQRAERRRLAAFERELPETVDLLGLALGSGLNVPLAVAAVGFRGTGPLAAELQLASAEAAKGRRLGDALEAVIDRCGESVRPLMALLAAGERYGVPLAESLERLAVDVRASERRRVEEAARRLPVKMLFPLVVCILPAFGLLTLGPMLVTSFPQLTF